MPVKSGGYKKFVKEDKNTSQTVEEATAKGQGAPQEKKPAPESESSGKSSYVSTKGPGPYGGL